MRPFPNVFDPSALLGPRGRQVPRREDSFQQLIGDGLRELRGGIGVAVAPTHGRDGSIDIFVEPAASGEDRCLPGLPKPLIVECKDHDEAAGNLRDKVFAGWRAVADRLGRQAAEGWRGNYAPWNSARAYVYAVSAHLPAPALRRELRDRIVSFFDSLPNCPPLERIEVLDWSDVRAFLDLTPRLADRWLGVGLETLLGHAEQIHRFTGFRSYLLEANLPFLAPSGDDPAHPDVLFARLGEASRERGLLLEGPGGVGKSRTLIEVATRADAAGWRVLHAQAGEPALTDDDLEKAVLAGTGPTLLVLDYLDQMQLDLVRLRQRLQPAAAARGVRLALLANARPGAPTPSGARETLFDLVPLRPSEDRSRAISDRLLATLAPRALGRLGRERLREICGLRPIVALFIAREVERREEAGTLDDERLSGVRSGDLSDWLRKRLTESDLAVPPARSRLEPAEPSPHLVAATAMLAAAPLAEAAIAAAGERALRAAGPGASVDPADAARHLIGVLREMGWLEARGIDLATAHDVVADEVVHDLLADRPAALVRRSALAALLAPALGSARTFGRLAVALRRVLGMEGIPERVAADLATAAVTWLRREAESLGSMLSHTEIDEVSFALGAVVQGVPWAEAALEQWDILITPFLEARGDRPAARHLLYRGLAKLPEGHGVLLFRAAFRWLNANGLSPEASFVVGPVLGRGDLETAQVRDAVSYGLAWLKSFGDRIEAQFVLHSLLGRGDLEANQAREAVSYGLAWLKGFGDRIEVRFVLDPLLGRGDLEANQTREAISYGLAWLKGFGDRIEAGFVLSPLLGRGDLEANQTREAVSYGLAWLKSFGDRIEAEFVLHSLLGRGDLEATQAREAVSYGLAWLKRFGDRIEAQFVLHSLLGRGDLEATQVSEAANYGLAWLESFGSRIEAQFVLRSLLERGDLKADKARQAAEKGLAWLRSFGNQLESQFVLKTLLGREDLEAGQASQGVVHCMTWLASFSLQFDAGYVLPPLLGRTDLGTAEARLAVVHSLAWLRSFGDQSDAGFVLSSLLEREDLTQNEVLSGATSATEWLRESPKGAEQDFVLKSLLLRADLPTQLLVETQLIAARWAREHPARDDASFMLKRLLTRADLEPQAARESVAAGVLWLQANQRHPNAGFVLVPLLQRDDVRGALRETVLGLALSWLRRAPVNDNRNFALTALLRKASDLREADRRFVVREALSWLKLAPRSAESIEFIRKRLRRAAEGLPEMDEVKAWEAANPEPLQEVTKTPFFELTRNLAQRARETDFQPSAEWLNSMLDQVEGVLQEGRASSAGYAIPALLPLAARHGNDEAFARAKACAVRFWNHPSLAASHIYGFSRTCYELLDRGTWPDRQEGEEVLRALGIERPNG